MKASEIMRIAELNTKISNIKFLKSEKENDEYIAMLNRKYTSYAGEKIINLEIKKWNIEGNTLVLWV